MDDEGESFPASRNQSALREDAWMSDGGEGAGNSGWVIIEEGMVGVL